MAEHNHEQIWRIFDLVLAAPTNEREVILDRECASDAELKKRLQAMIAAAEDPQFLASPTAPANPAAPHNARTAAMAALRKSAKPDTTDLSGTRLGPYKLLQRIGEGGFGTVYLAEQDAPVRRKVALKIIAPGMDSKQVIGRFEAERQALALMEHPHIARIFDGGITADSRPYFVMEYVVGDIITAFVDAHKLSVPERLELFQQVCHAVQHAHTKGIIHRDLKPGNILVSMVDGRPFAKVIDFGIAKATGAAGGRLSDKSFFTEHRQLMGTPEYMSPEQAEGSADIDTKTDVYALGVLLYELLTGATPFDSKRLRSAAIAEVQRIIKEEEPPMPSLRLSRSLDTLASTAALRRVEPARLSALVKGELDWIVMKALEKERARRYETATALAADVGHHLAGAPVQAAPPSTAYRVRKFIRRNKGPVIAGTAIAATLLVGIAGTTWQWREAKRQHNIAEASLEEIQSTNTKLVESLQSADSHLLEAIGSTITSPPSSGTDPATTEGKLDQLVGKIAFASGMLMVRNEQLLKQTDDAEWLAYTSSLASAQMAMDAGNYPEARTRLANCPNSKRGWEWTALDLKAHSIVWALPDRSVRSASFSRDGTRIVACANYGTTPLVWDASNGSELAKLVGHTREVQSGSFSPDGNRVVTASKDKTAGVWDIVKRQEPIFLEGHTDWVQFASFSPDGSRVVTASDDKTARVWDAASGRELAKLEGHADELLFASFSSDGTRIVTASKDKSARIWDASTYRETATLTGHGGNVWTASFSHDAARLATISTDKTVRVWNTATGRELTKLEVPGDIIFAAYFSPDGNRVTTKSYDRIERVWDAATGDIVSTSFVPAEHFEGISSPDGKRVFVPQDLESSTPTSLRDRDTFDPTTRTYAHDDLSLELAAILASCPQPPLSGLSILTPDGTRRIVAGGAGGAGGGGADRTVRFFEVKGGPGAPKPLANPGDGGGVGVGGLAKPLPEGGVGVGSPRTSALRADTIPSTASTSVSSSPSAPSSSTLPETSTPEPPPVGLVDKAGSGRLAPPEPTYEGDPSRREGVPESPSRREGLPERELAVFTLDEAITNLHMTGDGTRLIIELADGSARVWDIRPAAERRADLQREWAERGPAGEYLDGLWNAVQPAGAPAGGAGAAPGDAPAPVPAPPPPPPPAPQAGAATPTPPPDATPTPKIATEALRDAIVNDAGLTPLRRLVAVQLLAERMEELDQAVREAFEKLTEGQTDKAAVQAAAQAADLPMRVKAKVMAKAGGWEYKPKEASAEERLKEEESLRFLREVELKIGESNAKLDLPPFITSNSSIRHAQLLVAAGRPFEALTYCKMYSEGDFSGFYMRGSKPTADGAQSRIETATGPTEYCFEAIARPTTMAIAYCLIGDVERSRESRLRLENLATERKELEAKDPEFVELWDQELASARVLCDLVGNHEPSLIEARAKVAAGSSLDSERSRLRSMRELPVWVRAMFSASLGETQEIADQREFDRLQLQLQLLSMQLDDAEKRRAKPTDQLVGSLDSLAERLPRSSSAQRIYARAALRAEAFTVAIASALHSDVVRKDKGSSADPRTAAIQAIAHWRLANGAPLQEWEAEEPLTDVQRDGHRADAMKALTKARAIMADPTALAPNGKPWAEDADAKALLAEAEALIEGGVGRP